MTLLARARERMLRDGLREHGRQYAGGWTSQSIHEWQLQRFNDLWGEVSRNVPYWTRLRESGALPEHFSSWKEFRDQVPPMDRATLKREEQNLMDRRRAPDAWRATGGSTAEPFRIPVWKEEARRAAIDLWFARSWFGITPAERLFLIWGHSHLFGQGARGKANAIARQAKDRALGYHRHSAYDLSDEALQRAAWELLRFRPSYVLGYSVALHRFARVNRDLRARFAELGLKVAIATAESFPSVESPALISEVLGCPVAMEYGAVETGPVAHQRPDGRFSVFWRSYLLEAVESPQVPGALELLVTSLRPRCLPMIRYRLGDLVRGDGEGLDSLHEMAGVVGRCNDFITLAGGGVIHSEAFTHVVRDLAWWSGYRVVQRGSEIRVEYVAPRTLVEPEERILRDRLGRIDPRLADVPIERVPSLPPTVAGKTRSIMRA